MIYILSTFLIHYISSTVYLAAMVIFDLVSTALAVKVEWQIEERKAHKLAQKLLSKDH
jgi:hypothetical protein